MIDAVMIAARSFANKPEEDNRNEEKAFEQVFLNSPNRAVNDERLIVERNKLDALRQVKVRNLRFVDCPA